MNKFRLGDHVRIIDPHHVAHDKAGKIIDIAHVKGGYLVEIDGKPKTLFTHQLTLADKERAE